MASRTNWLNVLPLAATATLALSDPAWGALQARGGSAVFDAKGPAGFQIEGKTSDVTVAESGADVTVVVALANLDTGIDLRNHHMRDKYLEVQKFPTATLTVGRGALKLPEDGHDVSATATGTMTLHGQSRPVSFSYKARRVHDTYDVTGSAHINMTEFGVIVPSYLGITVKPEVELTVHFAARDL